MTHPDVDPRWLPLLDLWHHDEDTDDQLTTDQPDEPVTKAPIDHCVGNDAE